MPRKETYSGPISAQAQQNLVSEGIENFELPKSVVMKIAKSSLPDNVKLQKETVHSLVKGSTVFINYLAATAHDVAQSKQHKSISASDVLKALETIEFSDMVNKLQSELLVYRELSKNDKGKKSTSTANGGSASAGASTKKTGSALPSVSAPPAGKGKNKEKPTNANTGSLLSGTPLSMPMPMPNPQPPYPHVYTYPQLHPHVSSASGAPASASASTSALVGGAGPFTSAPLDLDLPNAHSPMDIDYEAEERVSAAPPLAMAMSIGRPFHIPREDRELNGHDEEERGLREEEVEEVEEEVELEEDNDEEEEEEEEELEDKELIEEQELRDDGLGVEERAGMVRDDE